MLFGSHRRETLPSTSSVHRQLSAVGGCGTHIESSISGRRLAYNTHGGEVSRKNIG